MIKLTVITDEQNHFIVKANEPIRIEITKSNEKGDILAYVYKGTKINLNQKPCAIYDGTICRPPIYGENKNIVIK